MVQMRDVIEQTHLEVSALITLVIKSCGSFGKEAAPAARVLGGTPATGTFVFTGKDHGGHQKARKEHIKHYLQVAQYRMRKFQVEGDDAQAKPSGGERTCRIASA